MRIRMAPFLLCSINGSADGRFVEFYGIIASADPEKNTLGLSSGNADHSFISNKKTRIQDDLQVYKRN